MGVSAGMGYCGSPSRIRGGDCISGEMGLFSAGIGIVGSLLPLKGWGNCMSGGMGLFSLGMGLSSWIGTSSWGRGLSSGGIGISSDGSVLSSGGGGVCLLAHYLFHRIEWLHYLGEGGCHQLAQDHVSFFFSFSALILFSYPASENILFHPVQTNLDNSIKFLDSHDIAHATSVKKCDQFCPIALLTEKWKTTMTVIWEIVYRSGLEKYKKFFSTYKKILY